MRIDVVFCMYPIYYIRKGKFYMKKNLKKAVVLLLALVMAFAVEKRYFYLSNTSQTRISMGAHDLDTNYQMIVADKKSATVQKVRYTVEDHGSDGYYYLLPKKPGKPKLTTPRRKQ